MRPDLSSSKLIYADLTSNILKVAFEVHNQLGPGFSENLYEQAFICELQSRDISYEQQKVITVQYKGKPIGTYRLDLLIGDKVIVELKAVAQLTDLFKQQLVSYLKATNLPVGLLINIGNQRVEFERVVNTKHAV